MDRGYQRPAEALILQTSQTDLHIRAIPGWIQHHSTWRKSTARLRCSSHKLNIETSRYIDQSNPSLRLCDFCNKTLQHQAIEEEAHFLTVCPLYYAERERSTLPEATLTLLLRKDHESLNFADPKLTKIYIKVLP